jgi:cysteine desulfurase/selenocysteine lyase
MSTAIGVTASSRALDVTKVREDFPILRTMVHGKPLVYLDNAATTQKPASVIERMDEYYRTENSNVHRGVHLLSEKATTAYEGARENVRRFINAKSTREVIFTRGATESINLVALAWGRANVREGDEIVISTIEHHSNIVPWQLLATQVGAKLRVIPVNDRGELLVDEYEQFLGERTRMVAINHISNALGTINPVKEMVAMARARGITTLVDGAQAVPHTRVHMQDLGADFYAFSSHKMFGPTGIGVLWGREAVLEAMPPVIGGGDMILSVTFDKTTYNELPYRFEAGTPSIAEAIGFGAAIEYLEAIGMDAISSHETGLLAYATATLCEIPGLRIIGTAENKASVLSFTLDCAHPHDIGTIVDQEGVAIRTGHHCAQPAMQRFGVPATARASMALYNTKDDVDALARALKKVVELFG